jgi:prepilin-type N-terminal cleavage/methylation domain-containing protein
MAKGSSHRGLRRMAAFTLLELIMVLALFGLVATLIVGTGAAMLRESDEASVEQKTLTGIASARHQAVLTGEVLELRFNDKTRVLDWSKGSETLAGEDEVRFLPPARISSMLIGGRLVEQTIPFVRFYPDGTCDPFRLEVVQKGTSRITAIDPWTCTAMAPLPEDARRR